jgi:two-component system, chemotaxis family, response regulator Rcp1
VEERPLILLVDDNPGDADLLRIALAETRPDCELRVAADGEQALALLAGGTLPDLVLLDLHLPRLSGHELLEILRAGESHLRRLPIVIYSTSGAPEDVRRSYELAANSHVVKPQDLDRLFELARVLAGYWFDTVALPKD